MKMNGTNHRELPEIPFNLGYRARIKGKIETKKFKGE